MQESSFSAVFVGQESLLIQCAGTWIRRGHSVRMVVTPSADIRRWAERAGIPVAPSIAGLVAAPPSPFDYLFSVTHLSILPDAAINLPKRYAVNFHDGPLPRYAGLNVTTWAILNDEPEHAVTWHVIEPTLDSGGVLESLSFRIAPDETAFSLNTKCYEAGMSSFESLVARLESGPVAAKAQVGERRLYTRAHRPPSAGILNRPAAPPTRSV